jgi:hypothetical protein
VRENFSLTKKAEPPPTRGVNRDSGTDSANGGWLRRIVSRFEFNFVVRQNMHLISNSLHEIRHFCFDANPYPTGRRGLRRNRNVWRAASSELSHYKLEFTRQQTQ